MPEPIPPSHPSAVLRLLALVAGIALVLPSPSHAIDAGDMDPHLPTEVILAAMRFHSYTRRAEDKQEWEQRHAELLGILEAQLEKVSLTDNRAATALRTLIADFKDARFVIPKKGTKPAGDKHPLLPDGNTLLVQEEFHIDEPTRRSITFPFQIKEVPALIQVGIAGGSDDSGDKGLHYLLIDPVGRVIKRGFSKTDDFVWEKHEGTRNGTWRLVIEDLDTDLNDKRSPGNRGAVEVLSKSG
ncbi:MAG: hypothetical protein ACR2RV_29760 [Verrucomicrobiales bacterium]